jgi:hypothetical protein
MTGIEVNTYRVRAEELEAITLKGEILHIPYDQLGAPTLEVERAPQYIIYAGALALFSTVAFFTTGHIIGLAGWLAAALLAVAGPKNQYLIFSYGLRRLVYRCDTPKRAENCLDEVETARRNYRPPVAS